MKKRGCMLLFFSTQFVHLYGPMVRFLREHHGIETVLITLGKDRLPAEPSSIGLDLSDFKELVDLEAQLPAVPEDQLAPVSVLSKRASELEKKYNISMLELLRSDRHLGIEFINGAVFPRSKYGMSFSHQQAIDLATRMVQLFAELIERHEPEVVFCSSGALPSSALAEVAAANDIPVRFLVKGRKSEQQFHWSIDRYARWWGLQHAYAERTDNDIKGGADVEVAPIRMEMPSRMKAAVKRTQKSLGLGTLLRDLGMLALRSAKNHVSGRAGVYGNYNLIENMQLLIGRWRTRRAMRREEPLLPKLPEDLPFIFFPLQTEPESNLFAEVPECDNQLTVIDWLAKTLPGGWNLVVKEHPALTAPRPEHFWEQLRRYPNVRIAATHEDADALTDRAQGVAMINATLGYQAALRGVPVICFMAQYNGLLMPHVRHAKCYRSTRKALLDLSEGRLPSMKERLDAAAVFSAALDDCALDIDDAAIRLGVVGQEAVSDDDARRIADHLVFTIDHAGPTLSHENLQRAI